MTIGCFGTDISWIPAFAGMTRGKEIRFKIALFFE
jgi:hypothetical protein